MRNSFLKFLLIKRHVNNIVLYLTVHLTAIAGQAKSHDWKEVPNGEDTCRPFGKTINNTSKGHEFDLKSGKFETEK